MDRASSTANEAIEFTLLRRHRGCSTKYAETLLGGPLLPPPTTPASSNSYHLHKKKKTHAQGRRNSLTNCNSDVFLRSECTSSVCLLGYLTPMRRHSDATSIATRITRMPTTSTRHVHPTMSGQICATRLRPRFCSRLIGEAFAARVSLACSKKLTALSSDLCSVNTQTAQAEKPKMVRDKMKRKS